MGTMGPRLTGAWPTAELLRQYPNWENALDEEAEPGQDETTLRPSNVQDTITEAVTFTAAIATLANGVTCPAILELNAFEPYGVNVLTKDQEGWRLSADAGDRWTPFCETWLPESERMPGVALSDESIFPLKIVSVLRSRVSGAPYVLTIKKDGTLDAT